MKYIFRITFIVLVAAQFAFIQSKPAFTFCGKAGDCTMTWDEFMACSKKLETIDKTVSISSFMLTIKKAEKKDYVFVEYPSKGNAFSKAAMDMIEKLHKDKKLGDKLTIDAVQVVQSGKAARQVSGMVITLN